MRLGQITAKLRECFSNLLLHFGLRGERDLDDTYEIYVNRVARMTLPEAYKSQVQYVQASPKFHRQSGGVFQPVPFPGYSVITPPWADEADNQAFYEKLHSFQEQAVKQLPSNFLIPLPPDSFHMTLADLIWDSAYRHADETPEFQEKLRDRIAQTFQHSQSQVQQGEPICWQVLGVILMPRALGISLAPKDEKSYARILTLRRAIYQNSSLMALGIEQQYHLTAHITLGYFGDVSGDSDRALLSQTFVELNQNLLVDSALPPFVARRAELRKFDDMTRYYRDDHWPVLEF